MKPVIFLIFTVLTVLSMATSSEAGWLIYHEPEFKGSILDYDKKLPIEGTVVVAVYRKASMGLGAGSIDSIINVREALTDKKGNFHIPSYTTLIQPFSWQIPTTFIIFKPGYASLELGKSYFTGEETREQEWPWRGNPELKFRLSWPGIVELPRLKTTVERSYAMPSPVGDNSDYKKQQLLIRSINDERKNLGLKSEYKVNGGY